MCIWKYRWGGVGARVLVVCGLPFVCATQGAGGILDRSPRLLVVSKINLSPWYVIFAELEMAGRSQIADLIRGVHAPWEARLRFAYNEAIEGSKVQIKFMHVHQLATTLASQTAAGTSMFVRRATYNMEEIDFIRIETVGAKQVLHDNSIAELEAIGCDDEDDSLFADMRAAADVDEVANLQHEEDCGDDYPGHEKEVVKLVESIHEFIASMKKDLKGLGDDVEDPMTEEPEDEDGDDSRDDDTRPPAPDELEQYDHYIIRTKNHKLRDVVDAGGKIIGQLQPMMNFGALTVFALCKCGKHTGRRCSRGRAWKAKKGEDGLAPERLMVKWLLDGTTLPSTDRHMALPRG